MQHRVLTTPKVVPEKRITVQKIEGVYIDYRSRSITVTVGDYENASDELPLRDMSGSIMLDDVATGDVVIHFKHVFKAIREQALAAQLLGAGEDHE